MQLRRDRLLLNSKLTRIRGRLLVWCRDIVMNFMAALVSKVLVEPSEVLRCGTTSV